MTRPRLLQQAGAELPLNLGQEYDLPEVIATSLIATGAAEGVIAAVGARDGAASLVPPETKPAAVPEVKGDRRRT